MDPENKIETLVEKVDSEKDRLADIRSELITILAYSENEKKVSIEKLNTPHANTNKGLIKFDLVARTDELDRLSELVRESFLNDTHITWDDEKDEWVLRATYKGKI